MNTLARILLLGCTWMVLCFPAAGNVLRVPADYPTIQAAIAAAVDQDEIVVSPGTYGRINFAGKAITVRSESGPEVTILNGNAGGPVVTFEQGEDRDSVLQGFTIENGTGRVLHSEEGYRGGGILCLDASPSILNNRIINNYVAGTIGDWCCEVRFRGGEGGGLYCHGGSPRIEGNLIANNYAEAGFDYFWDASSSGGGLYSSILVGSIVRNNVFVGNIGGAGGGAFIGSHDFSHNTVAFNTSTGVKSYRGFVRHCIVWGNARAIDVGPFGRVQYSCIQGGYSGPGNISLDPLFVDEASGDYRLQAHSPCVDTGLNASLSFTDLMGNSRLLDGNLDGLATVDMGALEYTNVRLTVSGNATPGGQVLIDSVGKDQIRVALILAAQPGASLLLPFGYALFDFASPWMVFNLGVLDHSITFQVPSNLPTPQTVVLQELAWDSATLHGNFSNAVQLTVE